MKTATKPATLSTGCTLSTACECSECQHSRLPGCWCGKPECLVCLVESLAAKK